MISKLEKRLKPAAGRMVSDAERRRIKAQIESLKKSRPKPKPSKTSADKNTDPSKGSVRTGDAGGKKPYTIPKKKQAEIAKLMDEERQRIATEKRRRKEYPERKDKIAAEKRKQAKQDKRHETARTAHRNFPSSVPKKDWRTLPGKATAEDIKERDRISAISKKRYSRRGTGLTAETKATMERRAKAYRDRKAALEAQKKKQPDGSAQQKKTSESINKWAEELKKVIRKLQQRQDSVLRAKK